MPAKSLFAVLLFLSIHAVAQIDSLKTDTPSSDSTSIEEQDPDYLVAESDQDSTKKFGFKFAFDGMASTGNIERTLLQTTMAFDWKTSKLFKLSSNPSFIYGSQAGLLYEREFFDDIRFTIGYKKRLYGQGFTSWERSNLRNINNRWVQAFGVGYKLIRQKKAQISVSNFIMHEVTDYIGKDDINLWRNSARLVGEFAPIDKMRVNAIILYQPSVSQKNNVRWSSTLLIDYMIGKSISLRNKFDNVYESYVVDGRKNNDFRWTVGLAYEY